MVAHLNYTDTSRVSARAGEKTTVSVLHDAQLLLNKQQQIWGGVYIH